MGARDEGSALSVSPRLEGPSDARWTLLLAHGAGAGTTSDFFTELSTRLLGLGGEIGLRIALFDFPYMEQRMQTGRRRPPDRMPDLQRAYLDAIAALASEPERLVIGGKSMGGRVASMIADRAPIAGLVCLGYPFHPRGQPEKLRTAHLEELATPTLICQGVRDPLGSAEDVKGYCLSSNIRIEWLPDGDHDLVPRKRSGHTRAGNRDAAAAAIVRFIGSLP